MRTIIVTREQPVAKEILEEFSTPTICFQHVPLISCEPIPIPDSVYEEILVADWVFFTSAVAVSFFSSYIQQHQKIATVGAQTTAALRERGKSVSFEAQHHYADNFVKEWLALGLPSQKILLPQSDLSNPLIKELLEKAGHHVCAWSMYQTRSNSIGQRKLQQYLTKEQVVWTFASPSAWFSFSEVAPLFPKGHQIAVIGKSTARAVEESGNVVDFLPSNPSMFDMIKEIFKRR